MSVRRLSGLAALVLSILLAPSALHAQFGGMGGMGGMGRRGGMGRGGGGGRGGMGGARGAEPLINSVDLVLKHGSELALSDTQVAGVQRVRAHQDSAIAQLKQRLDSLGQARRDGSDGGDPLAAHGRTQERGELMVAYREVLKQNRDAAFVLLEKKQRKQAEKFESALKKEMENAEPAEPGMGARRGRGPGL